MGAVTLRLRLSQSGDCISITYIVLHTRIEICRTMAMQVQLVHTLDTVCALFLLAALFCTLGHHSSYNNPVILVPTLLFLIRLNLFKNRD